MPNSAARCRRTSRQRLGRQRPGAAQGMAAGVRRRIGGHSASNAAMRSGVSVSAVPSVTTGGCIGSRRGLRYAWTGTRCCRRCAMSWRSSGAQRAGRGSRRPPPEGAWVRKSSAHGLGAGSGTEPVLPERPLYRLEGYQAMGGVPVADATQWDHIEAGGRLGVSGV